MIRHVGLFVVAMQNFPPRKKPWQAGRRNKAPVPIWQDVLHVSGPPQFLYQRTLGRSYIISTTDDGRNEKVLASFNNFNPSGVVSIPITNRLSRVVILSQIILTIHKTMVLLNFKMICIHPTVVLVASWQQRTMEEEIYRKLLVD